MSETTSGEQPLPPSIAHRHDMNHFGRASNPDGLVPWSAATPPDIEAGRTSGRLRSCGYCGSMHPADVAAAIRAGAVGHWADRKYGWPHKAYFDGVPNPHAGAMESRMGASHAVPQCPKTGAPCAGGKQTFTQNASNRCDCMVTCPEKIVAGDLEGTAMVVVPDGFNSSNGSREYRWMQAGSPAPATTHGKFYTAHLQDATPEDRATIERHLGLAFEFTDDGLNVSWKPVATDGEG